MIKRLLTILLLVAVQQNLQAANKEISAKYLDELNAINAKRISSSNGKLNVSVAGTCLTTLLLDVKKHWNELTEETQTAFRSYLTRPVLSGTEYIGTTTNFAFHFTDSGSDAVDLTDNDASGYPDYVETMAFIFENCWTTYLGRNFSMPPHDGTAGGDNLYDVYIGDIGQGLYGFVSPENIIGDNPQSSGITEASAVTSWMGMNTDYSWAPNITVLQAIEVTAAHEFFHAVQFGTTSETSNFLAEATAAWSEDEIYPGVNDNFQYLPEIFARPDIALNWSRNDGNNGDPYSSHWYGEWIFFRYLAEHNGTDIVRAIYNRTITQPNDLEAINDVLTSTYGSNLKAMFEKSLISLDVLSSASSYSPYQLNKADDYYNYLSSYCGGVCYENSYSYTGTQIVHHSNTNGNHRLMRMSADFIDVSSNSNYTLRLIKNNQNADIDIVLLKYDFTAGTVNVQHSTPIGSDPFIRIIDNSLYDAYTLLVIRYDRNVTDTLSQDYTLKIDNATAGIDEISESPIIVYPNPATDYFEINTDGRNTIESICIYDLCGKIVYDEELQSAISTVKILAPELQNGYYLITVKFKDHTTSTQKILIQK
ncbi:MAG: T9SS type A sorting domain-containing protein [Bacteroidia bacterium]